MGLGLGLGPGLGLGFEKQPSAQKRPHGERPYLSTNLCAHACRKPVKAKAQTREQQICLAADPRSSLV